MSVIKLSEKDIIRKGSDKIKLKKEDLSYDTTHILGIEKDYRESSSLINDYIKRRNNQEWMSEEEVDNYRSALERYTSSANALRKFGDSNEDDDKKWSEYVSDLSVDLDSAYEFYSTYKTEGDYHGYIMTKTGDKTDSDSVKARQDSYQSITSRIAEIDKELDNWGFDRVQTWTYTDGGIPVPTYTAQRVNKKDYDALVAEKDRLQAYVRQYERDGKDKDVLFAEHAGKEDYAVKSANRDFYNSTKEDYDKFDTYAYGGYIGYYDGSDSTRVEASQTYDLAGEEAKLAINDPLGFYLNNYSADRSAEGEDSFYSPDTTTKGVEYLEVLSDGDKSHWGNITDDELQMYYYLLNDQGKESAMSFLSGLESELGYRETEDYKEYLEDASLAEVVFANALSIPANIIGGATALVDEGVSALKGEDPNFYNSAHAMKNFAETTRGVTAQELNELTNNGEFLGMTAGDAYQALMSGADSFVGANLFGPAYMGFMVTGAMSSGVKDLYEKGASTEQIIAGAAFNGAAEWLGEKIPLDNFFKMKGSTASIAQLIGRTFLQGGYELGGEMITEIANIVGEAINLRSESEWAKLLEKNDGAFWKTVKELATDKVWKAGAGGFISGMLMGGAQTTADYVANKPAIEADGANIIAQGGVDDLKALALDMAGTQSGISNFATKVFLNHMAGNVSASSSAGKVGQLSNLVDSIRNEQNIADIEKSLMEKGLTKKQAEQAAQHIYYDTDVDSIKSMSVRKIMESDAVHDWYQESYANDSYSVNARNRQHNLARAGYKETEDGTIALSDHNQQKVNEILKKSFDKQSEGIEAKVAENGKAKVVSTDTDVTLKGIDHIETKKNDDGKNVKVAYLKAVDADGNESVVEWGDVEFGSRNEAVLYETFVGMDIDPAYFDAFVKNFNEAYYDASIGEAALQYATGFRNAFRYGWANMETEMNGDMFASKLTESVRNTAYTLGKESIESKIDAEQKSLDTAVAERKASGKGKARTQGELHMADTIKTKPKKSFTKAQNAGIGLAKRLTSIGYDVYLFESHKDENGNWVDENGNEADNGFYRASDGSIHIDINAGRGDVSLMTYTLAHELVHSMRQYSPREFKVLADLLYKWYGKKGHSINELVANKMDELDCDWDTAYEEVIADSCESFLTDSNIADRITELQETDKGTAEIIRDKVLKFLKWMKSLFVDVDPDSAEGRFVREYKNEIDHLYDAFYNALASASETMQWVGSIAEAKTNAETLATAGITVDADTGSAVMNSVRYAPKTQAEIDKVAKALSESMGVSIDKAKAWVKSETSLTSIILDPSNAMFLDYEADDRYEAIKKNAEYPQGTVDFSNLCKKRREFTALLDKLQKEHPNRIITAAEMEQIRQVLIEENVEVACGLCYVEERRQLLGEIAQGFIDGYKNGTLKEAIAKELDAKDSYVPTIYDLITYDGYRALTTEHPSIAKAFQKFNNARGMQAGRLIEGIAEYKRDILKWSQKKVDFVNSVGGLRVFSFSDFEATHLIDLVQVIQDCAAKGVMIQAYTKVPAFANAVKDTNMKVNRSLIAKGTGIKYENGRMVLDLDPVEGIDINDKDFFDSTNSKNVGNVLVGMSNEQIRLAMKTPFVDYIIPFHTGLKGDILKAKKIDHWDNYKNFQTDKEYHPEKVTYNKDGSIKSDGWVVAEKQINVYVDVIQAAEAEGKPIKNKVDFVNKFLAVAKEKGLKPRFWNFLDVDANGEYTYTEGYHKFLVDFKLFDQQGNILPQEPVVPEFDDALNARILNEYVEGKKTPAPRDAVYDRLVNEVINGDVKKSSRKTGNSAEKVYNEKNTTKEGLIRGESRQETREAFLRRAVQEVLQVKTRGETAYGYRRVLPSDVAERSRQVEREFERLGIPSVIYDRLEVNRNGVTSVWTSEATTVRGDAVYINNAVLLNAMEVAGHEAYHFWDSSDEMSFYTDVLTYNIDFSSKHFVSFISEIGDGYSLDDEVDGAQWEKLMDEACAYISGFIHSGNHLDWVMPFIRDFSEVEAAWNALVSSRSQDVKKSDNDIRYSKRQKAPTFYSYMGVVADGLRLVYCNE